MPLLARRAASATERTLVYFRVTMYMRTPCVSVPALRIKAYRAAARLGPTSEMGHVWTAPWQELSDVSAALVGCGHVSGLLMRRVWPLALMLCADQVPNKNTHFRRGALTQAGSPDPRNNRICITSSCPRQLVLPIHLRASSCRQQQFRLLVPLAPDHDGPGHPSNLVGERHGRYLGRPTLH